MKFKIFFNAFLVGVQLECAQNGLFGCAAAEIAMRDVKIRTIGIAARRKKPWKGL
jgi:hypothetical protein